MITNASGNLLEADVDALVNTVNTVGVMGKGIAQQFRRAYPTMFKAYEAACKRGEVELGRMHVWPTSSLSGPRYVINFPTKGHWKASSRLADIESGLDDLAKIAKELELRSIAVPPLGCGNGGLEWSAVEPLIHKVLGALPGLDTRLFAPAGAPGAAVMVTAMSRPAMTAPRAALITIVRRYADLALDVSLIEVQKLLYFLQLAGEDLRLDFTKGRYGPYADGVRHMLSHIEGHYLSGFGDGSSHVLAAESLHLLAGAATAADELMVTMPDTSERIDRVLALVEGFETAYGLELLSSVHWVCMNEDEAASHDPERAAELIAEWNDRKRGLFSPVHVRIALDHLDDLGWLAVTAAA